MLPGSGFPALHFGRFLPCIFLISSLFRPVTAELMRLHAALRERDEVRAAPPREALAEGLAAVPEEFDGGEFLWFVWRSDLIFRRYCCWRG